MRKVHGRFWGSLLVAALLALGAISPTFATSPTTSSYVLHGTQQLADCGTFQVMDDYDGIVYVTNFYDNDGNLIKTHLAINATDTYRQSVTGQSITMPSHFMVILDRRTMVESGNGLQYHLMVPGLGHVLLDAGRAVYDYNVGAFVFFAGLHQVATGDTSGLCAAFT